jgi:hypothetical protein
MLRKRQQNLPGYFFREKVEKSFAGRRSVICTGVQEKTLKEKNKDYVSMFVAETCRSEGVHWVTMIFAPFFFLWNPLWVGVVMIGYAVAANLPCIITQRYNRIRLERLLHRRIKH